MQARLTLALPLLAFVLIGGCASVARLAYPLNEEVFRAKAGDYALDPSHATVIFAVDHLGFSTFYGRFDRLDGTLSFNPADPGASRVAVRVDTGSVNTNSPALDTQLRASSMFDSEQYPVATFISETIEKTGENKGIVSGRLTIRGVTRPVSLAATFGGSGTNPSSGQQTVGFNAEAVIRRSDFGLKAWLPLVGDEVRLIINAEFVKP
jgi:polyisoprenoid-binding protein YceI